jgi:hypothetical protein
MKNLSLIISTGLYLFFELFPLNDPPEEVEL